MAIDQHTIDEIVQRVLSVTDPEMIIVFGSAATGDMSQDSDIDLLVVESLPGDVREKSVKIGNALRGLGYSFDIVLMSTERFMETRDVVGGIAYPAVKYGKVIFEAA